VNTLLVIIHDDDRIAGTETGIGADLDGTYLAIHELVLGRGALKTVLGKVQRIATVVDLCETCMGIIVWQCCDMSSMLDRRSMTLFLHALSVSIYKLTKVETTRTHAGQLAYLRHSCLYPFPS